MEIYKIEITSNIYTFYYFLTTFIIKKYLISLFAGKEKIRNLAINFL